MNQFLKNHTLPSSVFLFIFLAGLVVCSCSSGPLKNEKTISGLSEQYIEAWKDFYPSAAFAAGDTRSAFAFESLSADKIDSWVSFNKKIQTNIQKIKSSKITLSFDTQVDAGILEKQAAAEIEKWEVDQSHLHSPALYSNLISQALTYVMVRTNLTPRDKIKAISQRLEGIRQLCAFALKSLKDGRPAETKGSIEVLQSSARFFAGQLPQMAQDWLDRGPGKDGKEQFSRECRAAAEAVNSLAGYLNTQILPNMTHSDTLGKDEYTQKLKAYTGLNITPEVLEKIAMKEIHEVSGLMVKLAVDYWQATYPAKHMPDDKAVVLETALADMEKDREDNQKDFLKLFIDLTQRVETFVREKKIAPLPARRTLYIDLSPAHFAGAAVGGVYPAGPFAPDADTLFYLPSIPDSAPDEAKDGFYRSFNNHFNAMIIAHEMVPGHYLHLKLAAASPHLLRSLFCSDLYAEGWASLCEEIMLDAGWNDNNLLTRLAHLRKRLENAVRAYVSVQVHCSGWKQEQMTQFAIEVGLLPRQFAVNLWHRVIGSPFQLTSYFIGYLGFRELYEQEKKKAGDHFDLYDFSRRILEAGSVPLDRLMELFN